jgi:hypothetical protein
MKKITSTDFLINVCEDLPKHEDHGEKDRYNGGWVKEITGID